MRPIKLRPQGPDLPQRKLRLRLPGRLGADLDAYRELYARTHGLEIDLPALIEGILEQFLASDRGFRRRGRSDGNTASNRTAERREGEPGDA